MNLLGTIVLVLMGLGCGGTIVALYAALLGARSECVAVKTVNKDLQQSALDATRQAQSFEMQFNSFKSIVENFTSKPVQIVPTDKQMHDFANLVGMYIAPTVDRNQVN